MADWNFVVKNSPKEIGNKLESSLGSTKRFVLSMNSEKINPVKFKIRKRLLLPFQINTQNNIIVNGKISKEHPGNKSAVKISFSQHPFSKILMYVHILLLLGFLAAIVLELSNNSYTYVFAGITLATGILLGIHLKKNFDKNVEEYRKLISEILDPQYLQKRT